MCLHHEKSRPFLVSMFRFRSCSGRIIQIAIGWQPEMVFSLGRFCSLVLMICFGVRIQSIDAYHLGHVPKCGGREIQIMLYDVYMIDAYVIDTYMYIYIYVYIDIMIMISVSHNCGNFDVFGEPQLPFLVRLGLKVRRTLPKMGPPNHPSLG